jgi:hypothetical protein
MVVGVLISGCGGRSEFDGVFKGELKLSGLCFSGVDIEAFTTRSTWSLAENGDSVSIVILGDNCDTFKARPVGRVATLESKQCPNVVETSGYSFEYFLGGRIVLSGDNLEVGLDGTLVVSGKESDECDISRDGTLLRVKE